jgi:hypothetical protein
MTLRLHVSVENWNDSTDEYSHISQWGLSKIHQRQLEQVLRKFYDHPNTKFKIKIERVIK